MPNDTTQTLKVTLSHARNPDIAGGYWSAPVDPARKVLRAVGTLEEASRVCRAYIERNGLGGGNWTGGRVYAPSGAEIARISFNGNAWDNAGQKIALVG